MRTHLLIVAMIITVLAGKAQVPATGAHLEGAVKDGQQRPLPGASVSLLKAGDSSTIQTVVADSRGAYAFGELPHGIYLLLVTATGYLKTYTASFELRGVGLQHQNLMLQSAATDLGAVTVTGQKQMVEQKIDRTVLNVDAAITNTGSNALEVLEKSPGVQVDKDGNISLRGKQGVIVLIDGRPSYLGGQDLANMLRGLQASQLSQIEIMTNPPAKYDAAGNSGVINIKTKKNRIRGFNGNLTAGMSQGVYGSTNESINANYRNNKVNIFGNYSFGRYNGYQQLDIYRRYINDDKSTNAVFEQRSNMRNRRTNNNFKIGMDYFLTPKTTLGIVLGGFDNPGSDIIDNTSYLKNAQLTVDSIVLAQNYMANTWKNGSANLNLRHQFDSTGHEFSFDADYIRYRVSNDQHFLNTTLSPSWVKWYDEQLKGDLPMNIDIYSAKADYTHPFNKTTRLEAGWKSSYVINDSKANYYVAGNSGWEVDYRKTNFFKYEENINAAYLNFNRQLTPKLGAQAGLRYENTNYKGHQYGNPARTDSSFRNSYGNLFPTLYVSYALNKSNQLSVSFGRRIDRPDYQNLNPFLFFIDKYTYGSGNPYMKPQYSNNYELSHIYKGFLTTTLFYSVTTDLMTETFDQDKNADGSKGYATIVRQGNIGRRENTGISVNLQVPIGKWLTSMIYMNYNYNRFSGMLYGENLHIEAGNFMMNMNNQLRLGKGWSGEVSGWMRSRGVEGQILLDPMGQLSAGIGKQVAHGKGTVKLNVRDIFYTQIPKGRINFQATEARFRNSRDNRVVNLTFAYRFGKPFSNTQQRNRGGANEEQSRVKSGN